ncbi:MFS multidrug transporter [Phlyctema vagabunda]|uniref:MFS multidrug transporter n=1 Tax=Phlyctema vagabunda TaxID=108571 RepID=A0ABR4PNF6_9HELO
MATDNHYFSQGRPEMDNESREDTPLLDTDSQSTPPKSDADIKWPVLILAAVLVLVFETGNAIRTAPLISRYQDVLCLDRGQHQQGNCSKDHSVASELALILGVSQFLECLPMILLSGLYGSMADKYGRRPILILGYLGMILSSAWTTCVVWFAPMIPLRLVWLGPAFTVIGGGPSVPISILMTSAADVVSSAQRVSVYSFIHGTSLVAVMLGSSFASVMMTSRGDNFPLLMGLGFMCSALGLSLFLPTTQPVIRLNIASNISSEAIVHTPRSWKLAIQDISIKSALKTTGRSFDALWQIRSAVPMLFAGFLAMLGQQVQILILQYIPERFNISLAKANGFNIVNYAVNLLVLFVLLPLASSSLLRQQNAFRKDVFLAQSSSFLFLAGALVLFVATNLSVAMLGMIFFGAGIGLSSLLRSLFVELFPPERAAFATTLISAVKSVGGSLSGPIYSYAFTMSLDLKGILQGLPFLVSAFCFLVTEFVLITIRTPPKDCVRRTNAFA